MLIESCVIFNMKLTIGFSDAQARMPGKRIQCKSTFMAEHIACIFSVATLFVLCNPDKVEVVWNDFLSIVTEKKLDVSKKINISTFRK